MKDEQFQDMTLIAMKCLLKRIERLEFLMEEDIAADFATSITATAFTKEDGEDWKNG